MCELKDTESPRIVMFLKNGELRKISIAGNGVVVDKAQVVTVLDLFIAVFAVFYVFDLVYLQSCSQLLRIFNGQALHRSKVKEIPSIR
jgi:hypothetical protein